MHARAQCCVCWCHPCHHHQCDQTHCRHHPLSLAFVRTALVCASIPMTMCTREWPEAARHEAAPSHARCWSFARCSEGERSQRATLPFACCACADQSGKHKRRKSANFILKNRLMTILILFVCFDAPQLRRNPRRERGVVSCVCVPLSLQRVLGVSGEQPRCLLPNS